MSESVELLPKLRSREEYFDYLDGYAVTTADELRERRTTRGVGKTYMLETVGRSRPAPALPSIFERMGFRLSAVEDDALYRVYDPSLRGDVGLVELVSERHPVFYTLLPSRQSDTWITRVVQGTPWLDRLWLSARLFDELWRWVQATASPRRFTQLKFDYEAFYEADDPAPLDDDDAASQSVQGDSEDREPIARRSSRFAMVDRVEAIQARLGALQEIYRPLRSIIQLRIPGVERGGHDFYFNGKVTNRSDSFIDHRQNVQFVLDTYRRVTERVENLLWFAPDETVVEGDGLRLRGAPVLLQFSERLGEQTFDRWIEATFGRKLNRFRLSGYPMRLSPTKVHVYGVDRHLWQPLMLELTDRHMYMVLPRGTCGNTIHRLLTNVQRFLDPGVVAWVGDQRFEDVVEGAMPTPPRAA
jgi:hypothetical protein